MGSNAGVEKLLEQCWLASFHDCPLSQAIVPPFKGSSQLGLLNVYTHPWVYNCSLPTGNSAGGLYLGLEYKYKLRKTKAVYVAKGEASSLLGKAFQVWPIEGNNVQTPGGNTSPMLYKKAKWTKSLPTVNFGGTNLALVCHWNLGRK